MNGDVKEKLFARGMVLFRQSRLIEAGELFRHLVEEQESNDPLHLSYHGLLTATVRGKPREGRKICQRAVALGSYEPQIFLNLVRVHETLDELDKAAEVLRDGIRRNLGDRRLLREIERISPRKAPPLSRLHRDHFLNRHLAILIARVTKRLPRKSQRNETRRRAPASAMRHMRTRRV
jgi:hypothetical protein